MCTAVYRFFFFFSAPTWMNNLDDEVYTTPFWKVVVLAPPVKREKNGHFIRNKSKNVPEH